MSKFCLLHAVSIQFFLKLHSGEKCSFIAARSSGKKLRMNERKVMDKSCCLKVEMRRVGIEIGAKLSRAL
jgi:hypothetical protein